MSLNPRAIATLGVGFGARQIARLGFDTVAQQVEHPFHPGQKRPSRRDSEDDTLARVIDKWDAIEAAQAREQKRPVDVQQAAIGQTDLPAAADVLQAETGAAITPHIGKPGKAAAVTAAPVPLVDMAIPISLARQEEARRAAAMRDEDALLAILLAADED